jgi:hypothetical protein
MPFSSVSENEGNRGKSAPFCIQNAPTLRTIFLEAAPISYPQIFLWSDGIRVVCIAIKEE